ncbi:cation:proton antiporter [Lacrimispora sp. NSJ-141]|uniref:Cation:proton antiporter n=1 Tax=Lientehia hominis TaxID=2897778 RepID=A0AAP2RLT1_9FIRM|nr:cation:proton antiporter [Lientehia hominis]MCD2493620.1 cation:proton antiporter [Lientehia hominis]
MEQLFSLSIALLAGLLMSRAAKVFKLPAVTAYLVAGILVGPYILGQLGITGLGFLSTENVKQYSIFSDVALGFIAFDIGNEFRLSQLKKIGKQAAVIAFTQALAATVLVDAVMIGLHFLMPSVVSLPMALVLGAIATATAPAATLMVVRQYKAKGPLTKILLPIVALDDAIGLVVFAVSSGVARALSSGTVDIISVLAEPLLEVVLSLILGSLMGGLLTIAERYFESNSKRLSIAITFVIFTVALSMMKFNVGGIEIGFSSLLVCMMLGTIFCNICDFSEDMMARADKWTAPLFILFFVLSGAELELGVFQNVAIVGIGIAYIIARSGGKCLGALGGAKWMKCDKNICRYLGITLLPQAGVALGMSMSVTQTMGETGRLIRNITLFSVLIYELAGPMMTKIALMKAGEISPRPEIVKQPNQEEA